MALSEQIKRIKIDLIIKLSVIISLLLVSLSAFYYFVVFLPRAEQAKIDLQKQEQADKGLKDQAAQEQKDQERIDAAQAKIVAEKKRQESEKASVIEKGWTEARSEIQKRLDAGYQLLTDDEQNLQASQDWLVKTYGDLSQMRDNPYFNAPLPLIHAWEQYKTDLEGSISAQQELIQIRQNIIHSIENRDIDTLSDLFNKEKTAVSLLSAWQEKIKRDRNNINVLRLNTAKSL